MNIEEQLLRKFIRECIKEAIVKKIVYRNGKRTTVYRTTNPNTKVVKQDGKRVERRISSAEHNRRKRSQKIASRKRRAKRNISNLKRQKTMRKRGNL